MIDSLELLDLGGLALRVKFAFHVGAKLQACSQIT